MVAGAVLHASLGAQVRDTIPKRPPSDSGKLVVPVPPGPDSLLRDSLARIAERDSIRRAKAADTIKAPIARAELPVDMGIGRRLHWNRDSLFATGALTLADLLEQIPGMATLRGGWIALPQVGAYLGDVRRVRLFFDGFEYLPLDPRGGGALDLSQINLWAAEELTIEQTAQEVRVYLRSWRVRSTTPETRTDVSTGDQATNLYRGFFGRRYANGLALQFAAQQFGTTPPGLQGSSSDQTGVVARLGWSHAQWSVDAFMTRIGRHRGTINKVSQVGNTLSITDSIPSVNSTRADYYVRLGYADADTSRLWAQAMVVGSSYEYSGIRTLTIENPITPEDSAFNRMSLDTTRTYGQYVVTGGMNAGPFRLSGVERVIAGKGKTFNVPSVRASVAMGRVAATAFAEARGADSVARADVSAQFTPLPFLSFIGSAGRTSDDRLPGTTISTNYARGEAGIRVRDLWLLGGVIRRDDALLGAPIAFNGMNPDSSFVLANDGAATGATIGIRGRLWRAFQGDFSATRWSDTAGLYRPRYQTRSEVFVRTNLLDQVPSGNLGIVGSIVHEYRSGTAFPLPTGIVRTPDYRTISTLLEIRILNATISWQFRNILGERYRQVPSLLMPRQTNFYGVRWSFFD